MAFTKTWLAPEWTDSKVTVSNFSLVRVNSSRGRADGVAIHLLNDLPTPLIYFDIPSRAKV